MWSVKKIYLDRAHKGSWKLKTFGRAEKLPYSQAEKRDAPSPQNSKSFKNQTAMTLIYKIMTESDPNVSSLQYIYSLSARSMQ